MLYVNLGWGKRIDWVWNGNSDCSGCEGEEKRQLYRAGVGLHDGSPSVSTTAPDMKRRLYLQLVTKMRV